MPEMNSGVTPRESSTPPRRSPPRVPYNLIFASMGPAMPLYFALTGWVMRLKSFSGGCPDA
jgi:hypothetical protein